MKRIAYSNVTRSFAFLLQIILVMTTLGLTIYVQNIASDFTYIKEALESKSYTESQFFRDELIQTINNANYFIECQNDLEVAGEYNGNKEVEISELLSNDKDISSFSSAYSYKLQDLLDWSQEGIETTTLYEILKEKYTDEDTIDMMASRLQNMGYDITVEDLEKSVIKESYKTSSRDNLLEYCFETDSFSEIEKASNEIQEAIATVSKEYDFYKQNETYFKSLDSTNFKIYITDYKGDVILNNCIDAYTDYLDFFDSKTGIIYNAANKEFTYNNFVNDDIYLDLFKVEGQVNYVYAVGVDTNYPHKDEFFKGNQTFINFRESIFAIIGSTAIISVCFLYLVAVCGRSSKDDNIYLNGFDKIKTEIGAGIMIGLGIMVLLIIDDFLYFSSNISIIVGMGIESALFTLGFLSLVKRIKAGQIWKNSIINNLFRWIFVFAKNRKVTTKLAVIYLGVLAINLGLLLIAFSAGSFFSLILWSFFAAAVGVYLLKEGVARQSILNGIKNISNGDLEFKINTKNLSAGNETLANAINNIGEGLHNAVDASVRNERLKTDLITNVSHDIKTPLTSIINYVDLIKRENIEDEKIRGYIEILDNKSQRLKNLTEDLVEASKISSGNIKLEMSKINFIELINQTEGEFSEKLEARGLHIIKQTPEVPIFILADGRRMWRVVENLYNNVVKYAMPNTRVYVDVKADNEKVVYSIKNISENPLNIEAEELTERFIRGDVSRSTEGSGLGLSIAKNLTTLQNGEFDIYLDGDLFKVTIIFPRVEEKMD